MEELIQGLVAKTGISEAQAKQVVQFLKDNASKVPQWLGSGNVADKIKGTLGGVFGGH